MAAHKHAEVIKAWADGAVVQYFEPEDDEWYDTEDPMWVDNTRYRVKPTELERVYPVTQMSYQELWVAATMRNAFNVEIRSGSQGRIFEDVANDALRHACDSGQIVTREEFDRAVGDRKARDMAVAEAVAKKGMDVFGYRLMNKEFDGIIAEVKP